MKGREQKYKNRLSKKDALIKLKEEKCERLTFSFYRYVLLSEELNDFRDELFQKWEKIGALGRIYIAKEGVNAQISLPKENFETFQKDLFSYEYFKDIPFKIAVEDDRESFWKLVIKVKKQIVADGLIENEYDVTNVGMHLGAKAFNQLINKDNTVIVDMRNKYESDIGHFENAICPQAKTFRDELPMTKALLQGKEGQNIALYCTGGIRCEKASAYLKHHGFKNVYQLHGGIIDYAHQIKKNNLPSRFKGKNFVFDNRGAERISDDVLTNCWNCNISCDNYVDILKNETQEMAIQCRECTEKLKNRFPEKSRI